jgi:DNA-directed RNA polymerase specialized sigma24 family protein
MYNKAQAQDSQHQLIERYAPLVKRIAFHLLARLPASVQVDDLIQAGMIGLLEWLDPQLDAPAELPTRRAFGAPIFVVASSDCKAAIERARALGSHIYCEPRDWTVTGADGAEKQMIGGSFFDLDGYFFEVNQQV